MATDVADAIDDAAQAGRGGRAIGGVTALVTEGDEDEGGGDLEDDEQGVGAGKADALDEEAGDDDGDGGEGPGAGGVEGEALHGGALADDVGHHGLPGGTVDGPEGGGSEDKKEEGDEGGGFAVGGDDEGEDADVHGDGEGLGGEQEAASVEAVGERAAVDAEAEHSRAADSGEKADEDDANVGVGVLLHPEDLGGDLERERALDEHEASKE